MKKNAAVASQNLWLKQIYNKEFRDKIKPHLEQIISLGEVAEDKDFPDVLNGIVSNRRKYFEDFEYGKHIARNVLHCMPEVMWKDKCLNILNVGAGFGEYSVIFRHLGHEVINTNGGEKWFTEDYKLALKILQFQSFELNFDNWYDPSGVLDWEYDLILCSEVLTLTTIKNKIKILGTLVERLKTNGRLVVINHKNAELTNPINIYSYFR